jgi:hypothetical protein
VQYYLINLNGNGCSKITHNINVNTCILQDYLDIVDDHYTGEEIHVIDDVKFRHRRALKDTGNNLGNYLMFTIIK